MARRHHHRYHRYHRYSNRYYSQPQPNYYNYNASLNKSRGPNYLKTGIKIIVAFIIIGIILVIFISNPSRVENSVSNILNGINAGILSQSINDNWTSSFIANVNVYRENQSLPALTQSSYLDNFSKTRFMEMTTDGHYQITHYGADQYSGYGEVVFYSAGYAPESYAQYVQSKAPLHWQLLVSPEFTSYGYYVGQAPDVEAEGYCNAPSELPGPGINVTQWLESYGCTPTVVNTTWLVIDLT